MKEFSILILGAIIGFLISNAGSLSADKYLDVTKFYNGKDGYSLSVPTGNQSKCIWTWESGNASVPNIIGTTANSATEKHTIEWHTDSRNLTVNCVDDFGNLYKGKLIN